MSNENKNLKRTELVVELPLSELSAVLMLASVPVAGDYLDTLLPDDEVNGYYNGNDDDNYDDGEASGEYYEDDFELQYLKKEAPRFFASLTRAFESIETDLDGIIMYHTFSGCLHPLNVAPGTEGDGTSRSIYANVVVLWKSGAAALAAANDEARKNMESHFDDGDLWDALLGELEGSESGKSDDDDLDLRDEEDKP